LYGSFTASWMLKHNIFIDGTIVLRKSESDFARYKRDTSIASLSVRLNLPQRLYEY
jgi:hypothetical protein